MWNPFRAPKLKTFEVAVPKVTALAMSPWQYRYHDGEKYPGGFGPTQVLFTDYWTLRQRSAQLFRQNGYARGIIRRLVTNVINTGLCLESTPEEKLLGLEEDALADWSEDVENRWHLWEQEPYLCDHLERSTFGALQAAAYAEALVAGDVLVVLRQDQRTGMPRVQLISGWAVQSPMHAKPARGNTIVHGVELDGLKRHVAYWVSQEDGTSKRLPVYGEKSGRRIAWLLYGTDNRLDDVRGEPILSIILQSLREIDRYRDAVQRKAVVNSMLAMFIKKTADKPGTKPMSGGATLRGIDTTVSSDGQVRNFRMAEEHPGLVVDELQQGEEPVGFQSHGTDEKFGDFEEAMVQAFAWWLEIPPEILRLSFSSNYSASQAANNEFTMRLNGARTKFGDEFCAPIYQEWLRSSVLSGSVKADGFLESLRDASQFVTYGAWTACDWSGHIKPAIKLSELISAYGTACDEGFITRALAARELFGRRYSKIVQQLARENEALAKARKPLVELEASKKPDPPTLPGKAPDPDAETEPEDDDAEAVRVTGSWGRASPPASV